MTRPWLRPSFILDCRLDSVVDTLVVDCGRFLVETSWEDRSMDRLAELRRGAASPDQVIKPSHSLVFTVITSSFFCLLIHY